MANINEGATAKQGSAAALEGGLDTLDLNQQVTFTLYIKLVLPFDGYVFWVKSSLLTQSALLNAFMLNETMLNAAQIVLIPKQTLTIAGSLHYSSQIQQQESEVQTNNQVIFTALEPVQAFNQTGPNTMYIAEDYIPDGAHDFDGKISFAFSARGRFYVASDLFHYVGTAIQPTDSTTIINASDQLIGRSLIVSNSLPVWLSLSHYMPPYPGFSCSLPLYPSFLLPLNLLPPYGVIHIGEDDTEATASAPLYGPSLQQQMLSSDNVRVTLYGLNNEAASDFLSAVLQYMTDYGTIGLQNQPVIRDAKRTVPEIQVIAQKKVIDFKVSYYQYQAREVARQMLEQLFLDVGVQPIASFFNLTSLQTA
jgi:hypothetical protein